ncbi:MAG: FAD-dependent oxidoreductase [Bacteroidia bacterium]|nr:FAD-dependent oxidoreductase [Bacteroidia bacterium]
MQPTQYPSISFWESNSLMKYDYIIVGGGIVGLSTAAELLEKDSDAKVLVLERGLFPSGASTKNAGFACFGSVSELWQDLNLIGEEGMLGLVEKRWKGLGLLKKRLGEKKLGYLNYGGYELLRGEELHYLDQLAKINKLLSPVFGTKVYKNAAERISQFAFSSDAVKGIIENPFEAQIDTGEMMRNLSNHVAALGVRILSGAEVNSWNVKSDRMEISVKNPMGGEELLFSCKKVAFCTNAFSQKFFPQLELKPGRGQVLITEPIEGLKIKGVFHMEEGYYYFRNYEDRLMLGGGRNLDFAGEQSLEMKTTDLIMDKLRALMEDIIIPDHPYEIADSWAGIMAFGESKEPICQQVDDRLFAALRLGGMGVAIGSALGQEMANLLLE